MPEMLLGTFMPSSVLQRSGLALQHWCPLIRYVSAVVTCSLALVGAHAQSPTDELLRQQDRERHLRELLERAPDVRLERAVGADEQPLVEGETPCFLIQRIDLVGGGADFSWVLAAIDRPEDPATGRCLGSGAINQLMTRLQNRLISRGFVTSRIVAGPQDLNSGVLTLTLIPGRIREIRTADGKDISVGLRTALPLKAGDLLNLRDIEQGLENLRRVPTADADIQILPPRDAQARPGESDLVLDWRQERWARINLGLDDSGTKATGRFIGSFTLSIDNGLGLNDLAYISLNHDLGGGVAGSRGTRGYTTHYSVPVGYWLLGATASGTTYHQAVAGATQTYRYGGESENGELRLTRLFHRDAASKTSGYLKAWVRQSNNYIDDTEILVQRRRTAGWEAGLSHRAFLGSASVDLDLANRRGTGAFGALPSPEEPFGEGSARAGIWTVGVQLGVPFRLGDLGFRYLAAGRLQRSDGPLVPQDRFAIGGRYTVRGFDGEMLLTGDRGWLWRNDLALSLRDTGAELYLGADAGAVSGRSTTHLIGRRLAGGVIGVRGNIASVTYDVFAGAPLSRPRGFASSEGLMGFTLGWSW